MMRTFLARSRALREDMRSRRQDDTNDECGMPWPSTFVEAKREIGVSAEANRDIDTSAAANRDTVAPTDIGHEAGGDGDGPGADSGLVRELHRVADAFERIAETLEVDRCERGARLDAVELLLRDLVTGLTHPTAVSPLVVGGSIESDPVGALPRDHTEIDLADPRIDADRGANHRQDR
jgi:hypothetical protein